MAYTTINKSSLHQNTVLYTGNNTGQSITGVGFAPDLIWNKSRTNTESHNVWDAVRGVGKGLVTNSNGGESSWATGVTSFDSDGWTMGTLDSMNDGSVNFVAWNWKANGAGSANTDGSITSTVSANTTAGFSICKVVKSGTSVENFGHGLGVAPSFVIGKSMTGTYSWICYHKDIGNTHAHYLHDNVAKVDSATFFNDTSPTNSLFTLGSDNAWNGTNIFYCFAEIDGYSKFGTYIGNGSSDGHFVNTGFRPAFVMIKHDGSSDWTINDTGRDPHNINDLRLFPNDPKVESSSSNSMDILSNGFKLRSTDSGNNGNGEEYQYAAFGQTIVGTNGVPATAR